MFIFIFYLTGLSWRVLQVLWRFRWHNSRCDVSHPSGKCFFFRWVDWFVGLSVMFKLIIFHRWIKGKHVLYCLRSNNNNNGVANFPHLQQMVEMHRNQGWDLTSACKSVICCCFCPCLISPCPPIMAHVR